MKSDQVLICGTPILIRNEYAKWCLWVLGGVTNYERRDLDNYNIYHKPCPPEYKDRFRSDEEYNAFCAVRDNWEVFRTIYSEEDAEWLQQKIEEWSDVSHPSSQDKTSVAKHQNWFIRIIRKLFNR